MPVVFKGTSEYAKNFKWNNSFRSASFSPKTQQVRRDAGLRSDEIYLYNEPKIASKKHVWHREPQVQSCLLWWPPEESEAKSESVEKVNAKSIELTSNAQSPVINFKAKREAREKMKKLTEISKSGIRSVKSSPTKKSVSTETSSKYKRNKFSQTPSPKPKATMTNTAPSSSVRTQIPSVATCTSKELSPKKIKEKNKPNKENEKENIPLRRKSGISKNRQLRTALNRQSEYQRMFSPPRQAVKSSPLLSALDVVHQSSAAVAPPLRSKSIYRSMSEYGANFNRIAKSPKKLELKENNASPPSPSLKLKVKDLQNPQHPMFPHYGSKNIQSEYNKEFSKKDDFIEDLRCKAEENKQKHEGTHIDPDHLMQVSSKENKRWEASSQGTKNSVRSISAESMSNIDNDEEDDSIETIPDSHSSYKNDMDPPINRKLAWDEASNGEVSVDENEDDGDNNKFSDAETKTEEDIKSISSALEGRVPTPRITTLNGAQRTHHDLTTPCKGGALLVSPPKVLKQGSTGSFISSSISKNKSAEPLTSVDKNGRQNNFYNVQPAGSATKDVYPLDEKRRRPLTLRSPERKQGLPSASGSPILLKSTTLSKTTPVRLNSNSPKNKSNTGSYQFLKSKYLKTSPAKLQPAKIISRAPIKGSLNNQEFQHCGPGPRTTPINLTEFNIEGNDDNLSIASSRVSVKTKDLLEKAKARKNFWSTR